MKDIGRIARSWTTVAAISATAGAALWLAKQGAVAATVAATGAPPESALIGVLYLTGIPLMIVGASGVAAQLLGGAAPIVWIPIAALSAPAIFFGVQAALDAIVDALAGPDAHWWWASEGGIVLTALLFLVAGAMALRAERRRRTSGSYATL